jgi:RimJ/RimL family protein N-acetyltransferase
MIELREYTLDFVTEYTQIRNNKEVLKYAYDKVPVPFTVKDAQKWIKQQIDVYPAERLLIFWKNNLVGEIGITLKDDIFRMNAEIGYFIGKPYWGNGIATRAIALMSEYVFQNFDVLRINAGVMKPNIASMRALEKNSFQLEVIRKQEVIKNNEIIDNYHWVKLRKIKKP